MLLTCQYFSFESVHAENGVGCKEMKFFLLDSNKLDKMHSDGKRTHLAFNIY